MIALIISFIFGLLIGSFLNVIIYRIPKGEPIFLSRSHCPKCNSQLKAIDLLPLASFILNKGKCRYCKCKISYQYPLVELGTAFIFLGLYLKYQLSFQFIILSFLSAALLTIGIIDAQKMIIPNQITYLGGGLGLITSLINKQINFLNSVFGMLLPALFLLFIVLITKGGMGVGDVKLSAMLGSFLGYKYTFLSIFIGAIIGSIIGLVLIVGGQKDWKSKLPFGTFISFSGILVIFFGCEIIDFII